MRKYIIRRFIMSLFQRAFLYVTRKRAKTAILFLLLTVIATLVLSGAAIKGAVKTAQLNLLIYFEI